MNFRLCLCSVLIHLIAIRSRAKRNNNVVPLSLAALLETLELVQLFLLNVFVRTLKGMKYISMISFYAIIRCELSLSFKHTQQFSPEMTTTSSAVRVVFCMCALFYEVLNFSKSFFVFFPFVPLSTQLC